jgi:hypothetical protein
MRRKLLLAAIGAVLLLTLVNHLRWTPALVYPLYPGIVTSRFVLRGHMQTLTLDKIGFAVELITNVIVYVLVCFLFLRRSVAR